MASSYARKPWSHRRRKRAAQLLTRMTVPAAAAEMGIDPSTLRRAAEKYGLFPPEDPDLVLFDDLAAEIGISSAPLVRAARRHKLKVICTRRRHLALSLEDAARLMELRPDPELEVSVRPADHYTLSELAAKWGIVPSAARARIPQDTPSLYWRRPGHAPLRLYHLGDVEPYRPETVLGALTAPQLAERLHITPSYVARLRHEGMPALPKRGQAGRYYYYPADVARWLADHKCPAHRRRGERLLQEIQTRKERR